MLIITLNVFKPEMIIKNYFKSLRQRILFNLSANNNPFFIYFYKYIYRPKSGTLAFYIDRLSKSVEDFFVVQVGANDGMTHDPIHKFIKRDHWQGILLEPQAQVFQKYLKGLYQNQPGITAINAALGRENGETTLYCIGFSDSRWATGLASFDRSVLEKSFASGHVMRQVQKEKGSLPDDQDQWISKLQVPVITVSTLLKKYAIRKIDLLQIDTEGYDYEIIKLFDFKEVKPTAISYENMHLSDFDKKACVIYLTENNYQVKHFGGNTLAVEKGLSLF